MTETLGSQPEQQEQRERPRVYVASLSDYNHMVLHGVWIDNVGDLDHLRDEIQVMLDTSAEAVAEEYAVHDFAGFGDWQPSEYESLEDLSRVAAGIEEHGPAFAAWVAYVGDARDELIDQFEDVFRGQWESVEAFTEEMLDDYGLNIHAGLPQWIASYVSVDLERLGWDMAIDLYVTEASDGGVWVFDPQAAS